jgi:hypothetical protein
MSAEGTEAVVETAEKVLARDIRKKLEPARFAGFPHLF